MTGKALPLSSKKAAVAQMTFHKLKIMNREIHHKTVPFPNISRYKLMKKGHFRWKMTYAQRI
jgi:hypothetical protein